MDKDVKMVIVMRDRFEGFDGKVITPRKGKFVAQGCHAACAFLIKKIQENKKFSEVEQEWLRTGTKKICVKVDSEEELILIHQKAKLAGILVNLVVDSGLTEFDGVPTQTCLALGPDLGKKIDILTGHLKLL